MQENESTIESKIRVQQADRIDHRFHRWAQMIGTDHLRVHS
jgi:hypothetical protein